MSRFDWRPGIGRRDWLSRKTLEHVSSMYLSPGFANEILHVYYAKELEKVANPLPQDEDEVLEVYELSLEQAQAAIADGTICDAKTVFAIQFWELLELKRRNGLA